METTVNGKAEKIKSAIKSTAEQSKETMKAIIGSYAKLNMQEVEDTVTGTLKSSFGKSMELAEDALDSITHSYTRQMEMNVDFNIKLVDAIKEINSANPDKVLNLIQENFDTSRKMALANTREMLKFYSKSTSLAINFSQDFGSTIHTQMESLVQAQNKGLYEFTEWASDWWKTVEKE